jgi:hypothetical protein
MDLGNLLGGLDTSKPGDVIELATDNRQALEMFGCHRDDSGAEARGFAQLR